MCYMESKMQEMYEHGFELEKAMSELMGKFEDWFLSIPDVDETLIIAKRDDFHYENDTVEKMWLEFKAGNE